MTKQQLEPDCRCGYPQKWLANPSIPVERDQLTGEFVFVHGDGRWRHVMRFCFWCGGRLPLPDHSQLFATVDAFERAEALDLANECRSISDVRRRFGAPDRSQEMTDLSVERYVQAAYPDADMPARFHHYLNRWKTLDVQIGEFANGAISIGISPKHLNRQQV